MINLKLKPLPIWFLYYFKLQTKSIQMYLTRSHSYTHVIRNIY